MTIRKPDGTETTSQEIVYEARLKARQEEIERRRLAVLSDVDISNMAPSMYVLSMLSDAQEKMRRGMTEFAYQIISDAKTIIDERLAKKDEHGRHI